jgi:hypothetical protein
LMGCLVFQLGTAPRPKISVCKISSVVRNKNLKDVTFRKSSSISSEPFDERP